MTPHNAAVLVNDQFKYTSDRKQFGFRDVWRVMRPGDMDGDCEDYALTILHQLAEENEAQMAWWLVTGKAKIHFHRHAERGTGHVSLEFNGRHIDNIVRRWNDGSALEKKGYRRLFWMPFPLVAMKILLGIPFHVFRK